MFDSPLPFRQLDFRARAQYPFEIGALIMAALAFPEVDKVHRMAEVKDALCADLLRATIKADRGRRSELVDAFPHYLSITPKESHRRRRTTQRRWRDRMVAARMMRPRLKAALLNAPLSLPCSVPRASINAISNYVVGSDSEEVAHNFRARVWRPSRPIVALAAAMDFVQCVLKPMETAAPYDLQDLNIHRAVITIAQTRFEPIILADNALKMADNELIKIRWIE